MRRRIEPALRLCWWQNPSFDLSCVVAYARTGRLQYDSCPLVQCLLS